MNRTASIVLLALLISGCGQREQEPAAAEAVGEIKRRAIASLPAVGDYLPPVDDGRLSVAPPADWNVLPRGRSFLLGLAQGKPNELPRILISADMPPAGCPDRLTEENAAPLAEQWAAEVEGEVKAGWKRVPEFHLPIVLGETTFIRHVRHASLGGNLCAVQSLQTVRGGRLYTVELIVQIDPQRADDYGEALKRYRDFAYAVAAHLRFAADEAEQNPADRKGAGD